MQRKGKRSETNRKADPLRKARYKVIRTSFWRWITEPVDSYAALGWQARKRTRPEII